jgi:hypothetical protein
VETIAELAGLSVHAFGLLLVLALLAAFEIGR